MDHTDFVVFAPTGRTLERPLKERALSFCQLKYSGKISLAGCTVPYWKLCEIGRAVSPAP
jgi:hypothetical protein